MHFEYHKRLLLLLIVIELLLANFVAFEVKYNIFMVMGVVYFGVSFWFVFGERKWWLYQFAGITYVFLVILNRILFIFNVPLERSEYHYLLAGLWTVVLLVHLFVEKNIGPPMASKPKDHPERYFPDDDD